MQVLLSQIAELKVNQVPSASALRSALLDPAVNIILQKLKSELSATKARLEETQNELSAWKFTPDSNTGKRLMAKCRLLYQENEELGKMTSNGRLAKLEGDLALQKSFSDEVKKSQSELDDFLQELDEDVEGMQSTIYFLQQELLATKEMVSSLEAENKKLKDSQNLHNHLNGDTSKAKHEVVRLSTSAKDSSDSEPELIIKVTEQDLMKTISDFDDEQEKDNCEIRTKSELITRTKDNNGVGSTIVDRTSKTNRLEFKKKRNYDSDSSDYSIERTKGVKKVRRSSVLSLDYNDLEDDALVISTNGETNISDGE
ncbi:pre-mRNA-splicing regulator female-lethal(2)D isoform X2 [Ctenocephalides felis]|nr:pre-mRNA-splicing regulator female-lethal(2)D isoform X2 [Ctenocephalides felis]XP_026472854.1 pre-mRNA-splicing regulator female-lethal(2)D isoform X2 [Ctenocephalides felis]